jgi:hypothetical protein
VSHALVLKIFTSAAAHLFKQSLLTKTPLLCSKASPASPAVGSSRCHTRMITVSAAEEEEEEEEEEELRRAG